VVPSVVVVIPSLSVPLSVVPSVVDEDEVDVVVFVVELVVWVVLVVAESSVVDESSPLQPTSDSMRAEARAIGRMNISYSWKLVSSQCDRARGRAVPQTYDIGARISNPRAV
jgi:hypothetical protein